MNRVAALVGLNLDYFQEFRRETAPTRPLPKRVLEDITEALNADPQGVFDVVDPTEALLLAKILITHKVDLGSGLLTQKDCRAYEEQTTYSRAESIAAIGETLRDLNFNTALDEQESRYLGQLLDWAESVNLLGAVHLFVKSLSEDDQVWDIEEAPIAVKRPRNADDAMAAILVLLLVDEYERHLHGLAGRFSYEKIVAEFPDLQRPLFAREQLLSKDGNVVVTKTAGSLERNSAAAYDEGASSIYLYGRQDLARLHEEKTEGNKPPPDGSILHELTHMGGFVPGLERTTITDERIAHFVESLYQLLTHGEEAVDQRLARQTLNYLRNYEEIRAAVLHFHGIDLNDLFPEAHRYFPSISMEAAKQFVRTTKTGLQEDRRRFDTLMQLSEEARLNFAVSSSLTQTLAGVRPMAQQNAFVMQPSDFQELHVRFGYLTYEPMDLSQFSSNNQIGPNQALEAWFQRNTELVATLSAETRASLRINPSEARLLKQAYPLFIVTAYRLSSQEGTDVTALLRDKVIPIIRLVEEKQTVASF